ncbi:MAG TPA: adenylate/guanylate cyclase domain-containing protein [Anaerolineales bacterium]|nr:adenylate/guanylate cyclase domain-containing protein [Anaerolineales bacterium]
MSHSPITKAWGDLTPNDVLQIYLLEGYDGLVKRAPLSARPRVLFEKSLKYLPADPRCVWCSAPFKGFGAPLMRAIGKDKSKYNPNLCTECEDFVRENKASAEVDMSLLFADIRGSTSLAEKLSPAVYSQLINRFYTVASDILVEAKAYIEKLAGDQVSAFFTPGLTGAEHYKIAIQAARDILRSTGHGETGGPWVAVGIGVHSGLTFYGAVGTPEGLTELSILGDPPNTAARLASSAKTGEILISKTIAEKAGLETSSLEMRELELKGKQEKVGVWVEKIGAQQ